jgi:archaellum component FlaC
MNINDLVKQLHMMENAAATEAADTIERLQNNLLDAIMARRNVCRLLDVAMEQNERVRAELEEARKEIEETLGLLDYAVKEADDFHDECHGGPIGGDPKMDAARRKAAGKKKGE